MTTRSARRLPVSAEPVPGGGVDFRVWAPDHEHIDVVLDDDAQAALTAEGDGWFSGLVRSAGVGTRYRFRLPDGRLLPDPASRRQADGPHGASTVVDPDTYRWSDDDWRGPAPGRHVVYEMHVGTFTPNGTWRAARERLPMLADLGITIIELMPVAEFPGRFNWGYDGVAPFAPASAYGAPDEMREFVDAAHALGLGVILDVVYNHMGPDGCYMREFAAAYFSTRHKTDWGDAINFDGEHSEPVRAFFLANVEYWIREFHLDGLRLDATQDIHDTGARHIIAEMVTRARSAADGRAVWIVAENEPQDTRLVRPIDDGGKGVDALWNDDFHHSAAVALTGKSEAYYSDYAGAPQEFISTARFGFLYQGQHYAWQEQGRGSHGLDLDARRFVNYIQNHDQIANSLDGRRIHQLTGPGELRALTALLLLLPAHAMLFQGQEFAASAPFLFFADHKPELARTVYEGRRKFLRQFPSLEGPDAQQRIDDPADRATFERCILDWSERKSHAATLRLHHDLIRLSRADAVFGAHGARLNGAVLAEHVFVLRFSHDAGERLLVINLGDDFRPRIVPEPLLAPPPSGAWRLLWSSEDPAYGGRGVVQPVTDGRWHVSGRSAAVLASAAT